MVDAPCLVMAAAMTPAAVPGHWVRPVMTRQLCLSANPQACLSANSQAVLAIEGLLDCRHFEKGFAMGPSQPARRVPHDRGRRHPAIRPDYLQLYRMKAGPDAKPADAEAAPAAADTGATQPTRSRGARIFLIVLIAAVGVNFGAILGLVGWGVLQAFGVFGEPAIETVQRAQGASISQLDAAVQALNASVMGLGVHVNAAGEREMATSRRMAEIGDAVGVLRSGMNDIRGGINEVRAAQAQEPWRQPVADLAASVAKVRGE